MIPIKVLLTVALLVAAPPLAAAQDDALPPARYPALAAAAATIEDFVPDGWQLEAQASGDLDGDGSADLAFVLHAKDPANIVASNLCGDTLDTNPRILAVALARRGGGYALAFANHSLIPRRDNACADDWFDAEGGLAIARGTLRIRLELFMSAGGWDMGHNQYSFRWQQGALRLIGFDVTNVRRNAGTLTEISINYLTRRIRTATGSTSSDAERVRWTRLAAHPLLTIDQVGDGMTFDPEGLISHMP